MRSRDNNHHLSRLQHSLYAHRQRHLRHLLHVPAEEARIGENSIVCESLDSGATREGGAGLVEGDVAVWPDAAEEEINSTDFTDGLFVREALRFEVWGGAAEHVDILWGNVDVGKEMGVHKGVVGRGVSGGDAYVFVL